MLAEDAWHDKQRLSLPMAGNGLGQYVSMCVCIYIYMYMYINIYIYIYIYVCVYNLNNNIHAYVWSKQDGVQPRIGSFAILPHRNSNAEAKSMMTCFQVSPAPSVGL